MQDQLGSAISLIGGILSRSLSGEDTFLKEILPQLGNAGKMLLDLFWSLSYHQRGILLPLIRPQPREVARNTKVDSFLFGKGFSEQPKAAKDLERSSKDLKVQSSIPEVTQKLGEVSRSAYRNYGGNLNSSRPPRRQGRYPRQQGQSLNYKRAQEHKSKYYKNPRK